MKVLNYSNSIFVILFFLSSNLVGEVTFYGKINTSYESAKKNPSSDTNFKNNVGVS